MKKVFSIITICVFIILILNLIGIIKFTWVVKGDETLNIKCGTKYTGLQIANKILFSNNTSNFCFSNNPH